MDVGTKLKKARKNYGLSQDDLALKLFLSRQTISNWETNKTLTKKKKSFLQNCWLTHFEFYCQGPKAPRGTTRRGGWC